MEALVAFGAALVALRLAGRLVGRWRERRAPELAAWAASLAAYALASGALAWGAAAGWSEAPFRLYYLFGGLLTAPLLGLGSLLLVRARWALPVSLVFCGLAAGVIVAETLRKPVGGPEIPGAAEHFDLFPARVLAIVGNTAGTVAVIGVAVATIRKRPLGNGLVIAGVAVAAAGSAPFGTGIASVGVSIGLAAVLLYAGFVAPGGARRSLAARVAPDDDPAERQHDQGRDRDQERASVGHENRHTENLKIS